MPLHVFTGVDQSSNGGAVPQLRGSVGSTGTVVLPVGISSVTTIVLFGNIWQGSALGRVAINGQYLIRPQSVGSGQFSLSFRVKVDLVVVGTFTTIFYTRTFAVGEQITIPIIWVRPASVIGAGDHAVQVEFTLDAGPGTFSFDNPNFTAVEWIV